jgi:hypothetical protein
MKRAGRWLFNFAVGVSAVLCAATITVGVRSIWTLDSFLSQSPTRSYQFLTGSGLLVASRGDTTGTRKYGPVPVARW